MAKKTTTASTSNTDRADYLRALRAELKGYERYGNEARAADVKAELARAGKATPRAASSTPASNTAATTPTVTR